MAHWDEKYFSKNNRQDLGFESVLAAEAQATITCQDHEYANECSQNYVAPSAEVMEAYRVKCYAEKNWNGRMGNSTFCRGDSVCEK